MDAIPKISSLKSAEAINLIDKIDRFFEAHLWTWEVDLCKRLGRRKRDPLFWAIMEHVRRVPGPANGINCDQWRKFRTLGVEMGMMPTISPSDAGRALQARRKTQ